MAINWMEREDTEGLPAFVVAALARYEDGVQTEVLSKTEEVQLSGAEEAAEAYAEAARTELISIIDFAIGRLESASD